MFQTEFPCRHSQAGSEMRFSQDIFGSITIEKQYLFHQGSNSILQIFSVKKSYCFEIWFYCKIGKKPILQNKFFITLGMCLFIQTDWSKFNPAKYFTIELESKEAVLGYFVNAQQIGFHHL